MKLHVIILSGCSEWQNTYTCMDMDQFWWRHMHCGSEATNRNFGFRDSGPYSACHCIHFHI